MDVKKDAQHHESLREMQTSITTKYNYVFITIAKILKT